MLETEEEIAGNNGRSVDRPNNAGTGHADAIDSKIDELHARDGHILTGRGDRELLPDVGRPIAQNRGPECVHPVVGALQGNFEGNARDALGGTGGFGAGKESARLRGAFDGEIARIED